MKDRYEDLTRFFEFQFGRMPHRDEFKDALRLNFTDRDLQVFFLLPFLGMMTQDKLEKKAARAGIPAEEVQAITKRLIPDGLVDSYVGPQGRVCGRAPIIALLEFQVRLKEDSPMRAVCTKIMNAMIEGQAEVIPTRTPYYRVLPVEKTLTGGGQAEVQVDAVVPDPRQVLPLDVISEMVKKEPLIVVADCYCRATKNIIGESCGHPLETCFYFNELGMVKLESGYARQVTYDEAMSILRDCEKAGLVHNVSNCEGKIQTLCNCCPCSCGVLKSVNRGQTNVAAPSRFQSAWLAERCTLCGDCVAACPTGVLALADGKLELRSDRCLGCGQCVAACPEQALYLAPRDRAPKIFSDNDALWRKLNMEAMVGLAMRKLTGR